MGEARALKGDEGSEKRSLTSSSEAGGHTGACRSCFQSETTKGESLVRARDTSASREVLPLSTAVCTGLQPIAWWWPGDTVSQQDQESGAQVGPRAKI